MSFFGLDIGASSIKVCKTTAVGSSGFGIDNVGIVANPAGSLDFANPDIRKNVGDAIKNLLKESGIKERRVVIAVPESQVYSRIIEMPSMSDAELSSAVSWEAEQFVPVPIAEVELDYTVVRRPLKGATENIMLVYLVAAQKKQLQSFVDFLITIGLEPAAVENEMLAASRSYMELATDASVLVLHMGALSTGISIIDNESLLFTYTMPTGGVSITRALAQTLSMQLPQAEEYKRTYGLNPSQFEGKIRQAIMVIMNGIIVEVRKAVEYHSNKSGSKIQKIVISGGGAYMPDLTGVMSENFPGVEVSIGDPFAYGKAMRGVVVPQERAVYGVAVGLSRRKF